MEIVNIRIDERLIHGQVAAVWSKATEANRIMVIDNTAVKSDIQKSALKMACPQQCKLSILSAKKACENLLNKKYTGEKIFIIVRSPEILCELYDMGFVFDKVNVGNMANKPESWAVKDTVYITEFDSRCFHTLSEKGVSFTAQRVPKDSVVDFMLLLDKRAEQREMSL